MKRLFPTLIALPGLLFCQLDTSVLQDNTWVNTWLPATPLSVNGSNWAYENDLQGDPLFGFFVMAPGHVIHPQDSYWYPYDPVANKWYKINSPTRAPRQ